MNATVSNVATIEEIQQITPELLLEMGSTRIGEMSKVVFDEVYQLDRHLKYDTDDPQKTLERQLQRGRLHTLYKILVAAIDGAIRREVDNYTLQSA